MPLLMNYLKVKGLHLQKQGQSQLLMLCYLKWEMQITNNPLFKLLNKNYAVKLDIKRI